MRHRVRPALLTVEVRVGGRAVAVHEMGEALRLSGNQAEASRHYAEAHRMLDDIRKEARSDDVLKRSDLATIYQESARWSQSPKA